MDRIVVLCPKCGNPIVLEENGRHLSKDMRSFEHVYEGWCLECVDRVVWHRNLLGSREYGASVGGSKQSGIRV